MGERFVEEAARQGVQHGIVVQRWHTQREREDRKYVAHPSVAAHRFECHNNSLPNLLRALTERVYNVDVGGKLVPTPRPAAGEWVRMSDIRRRVARRFRERTPHALRLTCDEFVQQCPAHKRALYAQAAAEFRHRGWSRRDAVLGSFVKFEKIKFAPSGPKSDPCPRLIQPRSVVFNVALGRYTRSVEKGLYLAIADVWDVDEGELVVMKGLGVVDVASQLRHKWLKYHQPVAVGLDASRFDQHVSIDALKWEHAVYKSIFDGGPGSNDLKRLLKEQLRNRGRAVVDGFKVDYECEGCRASGDMNTGLGNCLIMSCLVWLYCREKGIEASLANNGDDCLVFMDRRSLSRFSTGLDQWFLRMGFRMETEPPVFEFEGCEFCQCQPVWSGHEWVMVRNPLVALSKDVIALGLHDDSSYRKWCYAVGVGGGSLYGDLPLYRAFYNRLAEVGVRSRIDRSLAYQSSGFFRMLSYQVRRTTGRECVLDECRLSFARAFGISPSLQVEWEKALGGIDYSVGSGRPVGTELSVIFPT